MSAQGVNPFDIPQTHSDGTSTRIEVDNGALLSNTNGLITDSAQIGDSVLDTGNVDSTTIISSIISADNKGLSQNSANPFDIGATVQVPQPVEISQNPLEISEVKPTATEVSSPSNIKILVLVYSLAMLVILTLAISLDRKRFGSLLKSGVNSNNLKTLYRESKSWQHGQSIILYVFFFFNLSFIIWLIALKTHTSVLSNLFIVGGIVMVCYAVRHFVMWSISAIYPVGAEVSVHNFSISIHNMILGILILPIILAIEFMPGINISVWIYISLTILGIIYILRQAKGFLSCITMRGFNPFYFFIYLCAVEIAPFLVGYKMMLGAL